MKIIILLSLFLLGCSTNMKKNNIQKKFDTNNSPGYSIRKIQNDQIVLDEYGGLRAIDYNSIISKDDLWHLGSCTKSMTSFLIGILIDEKKLNFNDTLSKVISEPMNKSLKKITILDLLTHRSGLVEVTELKTKKAWTNAFTSKESVKNLRAQLAKEILSEDAKFRRDSQFEYSNSNYILLGYIIEKISGKEWEKIIQEKIFSKLSMTQCGFGPTATKDKTPPDQPWGHKLKDGKLISVQPLTKEIEPSDNPAAIGPAGTVHCSFNSWSLFLKEMMNSANGESTLLRQSTAAKFFELYKDDVTYAGWGAKKRDWAEGFTYTMVGSNTLNYAIFVIAPKKKIILMGATNSGTDESLIELSESLKKLIR